jgi:pimeloyl-ACP methyl ester carboxylesterase
LDEQQSCITAGDIRRAEREYKKALKEHNLVGSYRPPVILPHDCSCTLLSNYRKTNIILLPGFNSSGQEWDLFDSALRPCGHYLVQAPLDVKLGNMDLTDSLYHWLREKNLLNNTPLTLIGFSNGGIIARALLHKYGTMNVRRVIMIATPNWGTSLAVYGKIFVNHPGLKDLEVGSKFLNWLNKKYTAVRTVPHHVIVGEGAVDYEGHHHDGVVWESSATMGYTFPYVKVKTGEPVRLFPLNSAWHLNLTRSAWRRIGPSNDKAWPITLQYTRCFLAR